MAIARRRKRNAKSARQGYNRWQVAATAIGDPNMSPNRKLARKYPRAKRWLPLLLCVFCVLCVKPYPVFGQPKSAGPAGGKRGAKVPHQRDNAGPDVSALAKLYESRRFTTLDGQTMEYRLLRPLGFQAGRAYPLVVCLHGIPGEGKGNIRHLGTTVPVSVLARAEMRRRYPTFVIAPHSPNWWGDEPYPGRRPKRGKKHFPAMGVLLEMVDNLGREFGLDPNRLYVTGHGMGGFGTLNALKADPNMWAGAVVVSGGGDPNAAASFAHVPLWMFGGERSPILHYSKEIFFAIKAAGGRPKLTIFDKAPTTCWKRVYESQAVWDWLFDQRRRPPLPQPTTQPTSGATTNPAATRPKETPKIIYRENGVTKEYVPGG